MAGQFAAASSQYFSSTPQVTAYPLTFACWAILNSNAVVQALFSLSISGTTTRLAQVSSDGGNILVVSNNAAEFGSGAANLPSSGTWFHSAGVFTSTTSRLAYTDGVAGTLDSTSVTASTPDLYVMGARHSTTTGSLLDGQMAEVGLWNAALTQAEITLLTRGYSPSTVRPESLVLYAPLIRNFQDFVSAAALTNNGGVTVSPHPRVFNKRPWRVRKIPSPPPPPPTTVLFAQACL